MLMSIPLIISMMGLVQLYSDTLVMTLKKQQHLDLMNKKMGEKLGMAMVENPSEVMSGLISNIALVLSHL